MALAVPPCVRAQIWKPQLRDPWFEIREENDAIAIAMLSQGIPGKMPAIFDPRSCSPPRSLQFSMKSAGDCDYFCDLFPGIERPHCGLSGIGEACGRTIVRFVVLSGSACFGNWTRWWERCYTDKTLLDLIADCGVFDGKPDAPVTSTSLDLNLMKVYPLHGRNRAIASERYRRDSNH